MMTGNSWPAPARAEVEITSEQAGEPRIYGPFAAVVKGVDARGERFKVSAVLDTLTASDFCLRLRRLVSAGERLFVVVRIHKATVLLRGRVSQADPEEDGGCNLEVSISRSRFLDPDNEGFFSAAKSGLPPVGTAEAAL
jgi:hypothetical protein